MLIYDGNTNTRGIPPARIHEVANRIVVIAAPGGLGKDGYTFVGWNSAANGAGTSHMPGEVIYIPGEDHVL